MAKTEDVFSPINSLPPDCISRMISLASPRDACMFALTCTAFRSIVDTDDTWQLFLPSDYASILSRAISPVVFSSKKDLFIKLFTGKKCYMISARALDIASVNEPPYYWRWRSSPDSRFNDVVEKIIKSCITNIHGKIESKALSPKTRYGAYLIYKMETWRQHGHPIHPIMLRTFVNIGGQVSTRYVCLTHKQVNKTFNRFQAQCYYATQRGDGWTEVEIGEFCNENGDEGEIRMGLEEVGGIYWSKRDEISWQIVQGIEIRPKH